MINPLNTKEMGLNGVEGIHIIVGIEAQLIDIYKYTTMNILDECG